MRNVLGEAQRRGLIGQGDLEKVIAHAAGFADGVTRAPERCLDLGSGGGVPGLVLAEVWSSTRVALLDGRTKRAQFLVWAVREMGMDGRVEVIEQRAEEAGRSDAWRGSFDVVTARGFGSPAVTAECAAPFLRIGGRLIVSEPPADRAAATDGEEFGMAEVRWPDSGLAVLGLRTAVTWREPFSYRVLIQEEACPPRFPRRVGVPSKRPLF